jgi:hypothetical protein
MREKESYDGRNRTHQDCCLVLESGLARVVAFGGREI